MTKIDHDAAETFAAKLLHESEAMQLARAYIDLRAERELLVVVAEAADSLSTSGPCITFACKCAVCRLESAIKAWRER